ncbi:hypothetical protein phiOC_p347 [Ochrobactrum phage vB_OspM_OC]|nr:hypothetical protein phiOC_p347 [Ochrobactrum phage vB_OspM_OC]
MRKKYKFSCPCQDKEVTITWTTDDEDETVDFCPFCSANILDEDVPLEEDEDVSFYDND